ncbi:helix-turn-helix transcriptional regulator [Nonomuraea purpurea]|uniref:Helix-turn-helix transcriptional regulator n=2 Tax=Nonomuraea purpurea TaxID=1849276 RepID=A0ABV8G274_9ACTN
MMATVNLCLRDDSDPEPVDLDALSPRARALAEAVAQRLGGRCTIWVQSEKTIRQTMPDAERWYSADELDQPYRMGWSGWSHYPADSVMSQHDYLEQQCRRIPPQYSIIGAFAQQPVPSYEEGAADKGMTRDQVLKWLEAHGRKIAPSTWSAYTARGQAPKPSRYIGRTPIWDEADLIAWLER